MQLNSACCRALSEAKSAVLNLPVLQGPVTVAASQKVGRVVDMSWAPLPQPVGAGSVLALALDDGSLAFVDASQTLEQSTRRQRLQAFKHLIGGTWPYPQVSRHLMLDFWRHLAMPLGQSAAAAGAWQDGQGYSLQGVTRPAAVSALLLLLQGKLS